MHKLFPFFLLLLGCCMLISCALFRSPAENIKLNALFTDNMVLQRDKPVPVWGWADPGGKVQVEWQGHKYTAVAAKDSAWRVTLPPSPAGGPFEMIIRGKQELRLQDILVGEVWLCSGQSNMEMPLAGWGKINNFEQEIAAANHPQIRLITIPHMTTIRKMNNVSTEGWQVCTPATIPGFSATAYFFGRELNDQLNIPVGLIHSSWGGTIIEAWMSPEALKVIPDFTERVAEMEALKGREDKEREIYGQKLAAWEKAVETLDYGMTDADAPWFSPACDDAKWPTMKLPCIWEDSDLPAVDGLVWFRRSVNIPVDWAGQDLSISLGPIDDIDVTWFNGEIIGRKQLWNVPRVYAIPGRLVKPGANLIAVRVLDTGGLGGIYGEPAQMFLKSAGGQKISLAGPWAYMKSTSLQALPSQPLTPEGPNRLSVLFNGMIAPLVPYAMQGAIWYQGESNAGRAHQYETLFPAMIKDWRAQWAMGDFPFLFVQLANYLALQTGPEENNWAELRDAQTKTLAVPNTGMAVAIDIGDANDIHPKNKQDVGRRLALNALSIVYGKSIPYTGPMYQKMAIEGNKVRVSFTNVDGGLKAHGEKLQGFTIAGADKKFIWADAVIEGETVVVSAPQVEMPVAVRYAWANNPLCNLYNGAHLPASPFRTDDWPGVTFGVK